MPVHLDGPVLPIALDNDEIVGWVAGHDPGLPVQVRVDDDTPPFQLHAVPGLNDALPQFPFVRRVRAPIDLQALTPGRRVDIGLRFGEERVALSAELSADLAPLVHVQAGLRAQARAWCLAHLACPHCRARLPDRDAGTILCAACGKGFAQRHRAIDMISPDLRISSNIAGTDNVSSNPYTSNSLEVIERTVAAGGVVLDCGAGRRPLRRAGVVNVEIVDYPSTDVLAVGESLPFADGSFDAALSNAVLEHVRDPFACARELMRVVKPGGEVVAEVPFLQPVHGYPHHYYNMTQQGLRNLFEGLGEVVSCEVPLNGHPLLGIGWLLRSFLDGMPEEARQAFSARTIGDLAGLGATNLVTDPAFAMPQDAQATVACLNIIRVRKT